MARAVEVEWQFSVRDTDALARWLVHARFDDGWSVVRTARLRLRDAYFDTVDWRIARTGFALRVRTGAGEVEATLKAFGHARGGAVRRREITEPLIDARLGTLRRARGMVGRRVRRVVAASGLHRLFGLRTRRDVYVVRHRGRAVAELVLDRTRVVVRARPMRVLQRVEVEVKAGAPELVARFAATLRRQRHLKTVKTSKFETGLAVARLIVSARSGWQTTRVRSASRDAGRENLSPTGRRVP